MKKLSTWILVMFVAMYWGFRVVACLMASMNREFPIQPLNYQLEIVILFVVLAATLLIIKRNMIGSFIYLGAHGLYFGTSAIAGISAIFGGKGVGASEVLNVFMSVIGIILPVAVLLDMLADKARKANPKDKKTDWFYKNEQFDRKYDERADRNNYRTL